MPCQRGDLARCVGEEARVVCRGDLARARCAAAALRREGARGTGDCDGKVNVWPRGLLTVALGGVWQRGTRRFARKLALPIVVGVTRCTWRRAAARRFFLMISQQSADEVGAVLLHGPLFDLVWQARRLRRSPPLAKAVASPGAVSGERSEVASPPARAALSKDTDDRVGVLLLNLGGPDRLEDVEPFLYNLFADPDIIRLPRGLEFLQRPLARIASAGRAPKSREAYSSIGGGSPLRAITEQQARAIEEALAARGQPARVYVAMRYWNPFTEEAVQAIKHDGINRLVVLPLYPQFSISTSGSSLRLIEKLFRQDEYLAACLKHTVIPSWYQRRGYVSAMADLIERELLGSSFTGEADADRRGDVQIFFSAHGVSTSYVEEAGDPYKAEMEECVGLIMAEVRRRGYANAHTLAYQSRVGPVEWLKPYTDATIEELGAGGCRRLLAVPISFVSEHIETLEEIDIEYKELALESGVKEWGRVPALGLNEGFIGDMADAVLEALPYVGTITAASVPAGASLPNSTVPDLLDAYDREREALPPPVEVWQWGWTKSAETWNGRIAMAAFSTALLIEVTSGEGVLHALGIMR